MAAILYIVFPTEVYLKLRCLLRMEWAYFAVCVWDMRNADLIVGNISIHTPKTIDFGGAALKLCNGMKFVPTWNFVVI